MKTNLVSTGILFLSLTLGAMNAAAQTDDGTPVDPSVIARLKAARAAADAGTAPATEAGAATTPDAAATTTATPTPDAGAATAPATTIATAAVTPETGATAAAAIPAAAPTPIASAAPSGTPPTYASFDLIWQRNVFDPSRVPYDGRGPRTNPVIVRARAQRVETLVFCGTAHKVGMGYDAFFSGNGAPASGVLDVGDPVNGLKIAAITNDSVTLVDPASTNNSKLVVALENGPNAITRADGGPWRTMYVSTTYTPVPRPPQIDNNAALMALQMDAGGGDTTGFGGFNGGAAFGGQQGGFGNQFGGGGAGGRTRGGRGGRGGGGAGGGGGGFGGNNGGGNNFGFNGFQQQDTVTVAPPAPADPAVVARLKALREKGN